MRAIKIPADSKRPIETIDVSTNIEVLAMAIGGPCEQIQFFRCPLTRTYGLMGVVDGDGISNGQPVNERAWPLYPTPGFQLRGNVLLVAQEGAEFVDLPDERKTFLAVINLVAGADRRA